MSLAVDSLSFSYGTRRILDAVSFEVASGAFCALLGPNGSGKSTLIKILAGMQPMLAGYISLFGKHIA